MANAFALAYRAVSGFFDELKQRRVYRAAIGYGVAAWVIIQVAATILPPFNVPAWVLQAIIVVVALCFPAVLMLAWVVDLRSFHLRKATVLRRRNLFVLGAAGLLIAAAVIALCWVALYRGRFAARFAAPEKSIAVLPFANLSEDKTNEYFAEGMQDEILTRLAKIAELKVISRTSTERYKSRPGDLPTIARELGVANVLEGSVQRVGDSVRVNVQLIDARSDAHRWAEVYDRKLTDIFVVESEIAKTIAESLHAKLTGSEEQALARQPTANAAAYDAYLRGIAADARGLYSFEKLEQAAQFFGEATQLDPSFAIAWARLARADSFLYFRRQDATPARRDAAARALEEARRLAPSTPETLIAEAYFTYWVLRDYTKARTLFVEAGKLVPGASDVPFALASIARRRGRWDESIAQSLRAGELNPRDPLLLTERAWTYKIVRRFADALATYDRALEIIPGDADLIASKAAIHQAEGNLDEARRLLAPLRANVTEGSVANSIIAQAFLERDYREAIAQAKAILAQNISRSSREAYLVWLGLAQRLAGDTADASVTNSSARDTLAAHKEQEPNNEDVAALLSQAYASLGENAAAVAEAKRAMELMPVSADAVLGPGYEENLAAVQAQVGERDAAIATLTRLLQTPEINGTSIVDAPLTAGRLRLEPTWDAIRNDPRFEQLVR